MVTVKVFDKNGVKTVQLLGNANEQEYDPVPAFFIESEDSDTEDESAADLP